MRFWKGSLLLLLTSGALSLIQSQPAKAHAIESTLNYLNGKLELRSQFSTGQPVDGAVVRLMGADGMPGEELGRMDQQGKLNLSLPEISEGNLDVQIDGGPGHRDYLLLPVRSGKVQLEEVVIKPLPAKSIWSVAWAGSPFLLGLGGLLVSVNRQRLKY